MRPHPRAAALLLLLGLGSLACATAGSLREARGEGVTRFYRVDYDTLWNAVMESLRFNRLQVKESDPEERYVLAIRPGSHRGPGVREDEIAVSSDLGERVGVFVDSVAPGVWGVEVITKRRFALDITMEDWTVDVFQAIEWELPDSAAVEEPPPGAAPAGEEPPAGDGDSSRARGGPRPPR